PYTMDIKESHPVIISFITDLYIDLRPLSSAPYETFTQLPNMDHVQLQKFETSLSQATESKKYVNINLLFITAFHRGMIQIPDTAPVSSTRRTVSGVYSKPVIGVLDVVEDPYYVGIHECPILASLIDKDITNITDKKELIEKIEYLQQYLRKDYAKALLVNKQ
ncbi:1211_t:CDS:2, partial [Dentiscutata erythropus]